MRMRFGMCADIKVITDVKRAGFDFIELKTYDVAQMNDDEFEVLLLTIQDLGFGCEDLNFFYPPSMKVVGENIDEDQIFKYIKTAVYRAGRLKVKTIAVGSSKSRYIPEGFPLDKAKLQFVKQLKFIAQISAKYDIIVTIEPIRPASTNFINTISEGVELVLLAGEPNLFMMADYSQMMGAGDSLQNITQYGQYIKHLHTSDIKTMNFPFDEQDDGQLGFFEQAANIDYKGTLSVEVSEFTNWNDATRCLKTLRYFAQRYHI